MLRTYLLGALLFTSTASAADVFAHLPQGAGGPPGWPSGNLTGTFSDPAVWETGVVPGATDVAIVRSTAFDWTLTYDVTSPPVLGGFLNSRSEVYFEQDVTINGPMGQREGTFHDQGHDITVHGGFSNTADGLSSGNGGAFARGGGNYFLLGGMNLQRSSSFSFRAGDVIDGDVTTTRLNGAWPDFDVAQDGVHYSDALDSGLSLDDPTAVLQLGVTSSSDRSEIRLYWDSGLQGTNDWILRWKGDHVAELTTYINNGQIQAPGLPSGETFTAADNVYYVASDDYTYIGFQPEDIDGDGVPNASDVCPTDVLKGLDAGLCGCDYLDIDTNEDTVDDACVHRTAFVAPRAVLFPGALVEANAIVASRARITGTVGAGAIVGRTAVVQGTVGDNAIVGRGATLTASATLGMGSFLGYASNIDSSAVGDNTVIGALVALGYSSTIGDDVVLAREVDIGNGVTINDGVVIGPAGSIGHNCTIGSGTRIHKHADFGWNVLVGQDARIGRDATLGAIGGTTTEIGDDARLRASVTVPAGFCVADDERVARNTTVNTACP